MGRSSPLPTVTEPQQLNSSYPAWLLMNTDAANCQDGSVQCVLLDLRRGQMLITYSSFGPLTPSSIQTDLQTFTSSTSYPPPPTTSFSPGLFSIIRILSLHPRSRRSFGKTPHSKLLYEKGHETSTPTSAYLVHPASSIKVEPELTRIPKLVTVYSSSLQARHQLAVPG